jgi:1-acyl-sn-glycerol-3-phosphate acyltransferase
LVGTATGRAVADLLFPLVHLVVRGAVRVCFGRIATVGREHLARRGPALLVANHPAAWTDVVVVEVALGRRIHFIAHQPLFRPWIRGLLLELFAALPVWYRSEDPESFAHNEVTFARCRAAFRKGHVVAMFPEGVSGGDRDLLPLKTGAARLLLESASGGEHPLLIPIGIHYRDRTAFRTPVVVAVGAPIGFEMHRFGTGDPAAAARALTDDMARAIAAAMAAAATRASGGAPGESRGATGRRPALEARAPVATAAAVGRALHAIPLWAIERAARSLANHPQQIAFGRMVFGLVLIPLWYALLVGLAVLLGGGAWFLVPASAPVLGALACREHDRRPRATGHLP